MKKKHMRVTALLSAGVITAASITAGIFSASALSSATDSYYQLLQGDAVTIDNNLICEVLDQEADETFLLKINDVKDTSITSVTFPEEYDGYPIKFVALGASAFEDCTALTSVILPEEISVIPERAFYNCKSLTSVNIPAAVTSVGASAFYNTAIVNNQVTENGEEALVKYIDGWAVGTKSNRTDDEKDIVVEEGTVGIADSAFNNINSIQLPSTLKYIGNRAFINLSLVTYVNITEITLPEGLITIGNEAFKSTHLTSVTIPGTVESVGVGAFANSKIETAVIEPGVKEIKNDAFYGCSNLTSVTIGDGLEIMGQYAFSNNDALTDVTIGEEITELPYRTFSSCKFLKKIDLPDSLTYIDANAFEDSAIQENGLAQLKYADNWLIGYNSNNKEDTEVTVKDGTVRLAANALRGMGNLETVNLPDGLQYINCRAFSSYNDSLKEVTIPESVKYIGEEAFYGHKSMERLTILNPDCELYDGWYTLNGTVYGYNISTAHDYADKYGLDFVALDAEETTTTTTEITTTTTNTTTTTTKATTTTAKSTTTATTTQPTTTSTTTATTTAVTTTTATTTTEPELEAGDLDNDGTISINDATLVLSAYAQLAAGNDTELTAAQKAAADLNHDGVVDISDATCILIYYAKTAAGLDVSWDAILESIK